MKAIVGKHNLSIANEPGSVEHYVWEIIVHPDWDVTSFVYDADISLIVLQEQVNFGDGSSVATVCLPAQSDNEVLGTGFTAGWGFSEKSPKKVTETPNTLTLPAVNDSVCFKSDSDLQLVSSQRTFCAGFVNQSKTAW